MPRKSNVVCEICKKPLYRRPCEIKKVKFFCCKGCRSKLYKEKKNYYSKGLEKGWGWNKGKSKKNGDSLTYGRPRSLITKLKISKALKGKSRVTKQKIICENCKNIFCVLPSIKKRNRQFCNVICSNIYKHKNRIYLIGKDSPNWKGDDIEKTCLYCYIKYVPARNKRKIQKYCSQNCKNNAHSKFMVETPPFVRTCDTDIELIIENWLIDQKIKYEKQKTIIEARTIPDFFIEPNICFYADGDYWHSLDKTIKRDKRINKKLKYLGYKVIRIKGSDIKKGERPNELLYI